jgi:hypothetical protein
MPVAIQRAAASKVARHLATCSSGAVKAGPFAEGESPDSAVDTDDFIALWQRFKWKSH